MSRGLFVWFGLVTCASVVHHPTWEELLVPELKVLGADVNPVCKPRKRFSIPPSTHWTLNEKNKCHWEDFFVQHNYRKNWLERGVSSSHAGWCDLTFLLQLLHLPCPCCVPPPPVTLAMLIVPTLSHLLPTITYMAGKEVETMLSGWS